MKFLRSLIAALFITGGLSVLWADAPGILNYQGKLTDQNGNPITDGAGVAMEFSLYNVASGGSYLFRESRANVPVDNGVFTVQIGSMTAGGIPKSIFQTNTALYLGVKVGADAEMTPRERLVSAPYALAIATGSVGANEIIDSTITLAKVDLASFDSRYSATSPSTMTVTYSVFMATQSGRVGVGTTTPTGKLQVAGTAGVPALVVSSGTGTNQELVWVSSTGRVGVGTTSPTTNMEIRAVSADAYLMMSAGNGNEKGIEFLDTGNGRIWELMHAPGSSNNRLELWYYDGTWKQYASVTTDGYVGIGTSNPSYRMHVSSAAGAGTTIFAVSTGTVDLFAVHGTSVSLEVPLVFPDGTTQVSAAAASQWTTNGSSIGYTGGKVGIGTTAPAGPLEVRGQGGPGNNTYGHIRMADSVNPALFTYMGYDNLSNGWGYVQALQESVSERPFAVNPYGGNVIITWLGIGRVGVGTSDPQSKLDVRGDVVVLSSMAVSGTGITGSNAMFKVGGATLTATADGKVGIGTTAPVGKLDVVGSAGIPALVISSGTAASQELLRVSSTGWVEMGGQDFFYIKPSAGKINLGNDAPQFESQGLLNLVGDMTIQEGGALNLFGSGGDGWLRVYSPGDNQSVIEANGNAARWLSLLSGAGESLVLRNGVGIGTTMPRYRLDVTTAAGVVGPVFAVSTGSVDLFRVLGTSVNLKVPLVFPDGTVQVTAAGTASQWTTNGSSIGYTDGAVGIGRTDPRGSLEVVGSASVPAFVVSSGTLASQELIRVSSVGYVGIGRTTPRAALEIGGDILLSGTAPTIRSSTGNPSLPLYVSAGSNMSGGVGGTLYLQGGDSVANAGPVYLRGGNTAGGGGGAVYIDAGSSFGSPSLVNLQTNVTGNPGVQIGNGNYRSNNRLQVTNGILSVTTTTVGIGTSNPAYLLEVTTITGFAGPLMVVSTGTSDIFRVNGTSVALKVPLYFPDGTAQVTAAQTTGLANPTASIGLTTVNGVASTAMRSDAAPALDQTISPAWSGVHTWTSSATFRNNEFNVGGSTFVVTAGRVGVGRTDPQGRLEIMASAGIPALVLSSGTLASQELMRVSSTGALGVGTTTPQGKMEVIGNMYVGDSLGNNKIYGNYGGSYFDFAHPGLGPAFNSYFSGAFLLDKESNDSNEYFAVFTNAASKTLFNVMDPGLVSVNRAYNVVPSASLDVVGTAGYPALTLSSGTAASQELMRVSSTGYVGIGTSTPSQRLHVAGDAVVSGGIQFGANSAYINGYDTTSPFIEFMVGDTGSGNTYGHGLILRRARTGTGATNWSNIGMINDTTLGIGVLESVGTSSKILALDSAGKLGIGTTTPSYRMHVSSAAGTTGSILAVSTGTTDLFAVHGTSVSLEVPLVFPDGTKQVTAGGIPSGAVMFFNLSVCPTGWSELTSARGRYVVGLPASGTLAGTAGTALTDQENRAVGQHNHSITDSGHTHGAGTLQNRGAWDVAGGGPGSISTTGTPGGMSGSITGNTGSATTGITISNSGSVAGTNAPYIQLLTCQKD